MSECQYCSYNDKFCNKFWFTGPVSYLEREIKDSAIISLSKEDVFWQTKKQEYITLEL